MKSSKAYRLLLIIGIPVLFALIIRGIFGISGLESFYKVMGLSFLILLPFGVGALTIYLSPVERVRKWPYRIFMPWVPILCFFLLTLVFSIEGWACWLMVLPLFIIAASIGGIIASYYKLKKDRNERVYVSLAALLPLLLSPAEQSISHIPGKYEAYTFIDIAAPPAKIWANVTRVREIPKDQDKGLLNSRLGFPRPIKAELNFEGVGAYRKAVFDKGLVFDETVTRYEPQRRMDFTIKANPYDIPSTTMDEHVVIGGKYFDVLNGTYILEPLSAGTCRLHLYSHFKLSTTFNFYASWWAGWIMKDIQQNILQVIKERAEL